MTDQKEQPEEIVPIKSGKKKKSRLREWTEAILFAFFAVMIFRLFFFEAYTIPSSSMEKSLLTGDYIFVSKLHYGARFPVTPLSFPFVHQHFSDSVKSFSEWIHFPYFRFPGFSKIKVNDVVVFNNPTQLQYPVDEREYFIKRCVALPGDTFVIREHEIYINEKKELFPVSAELEYIVITDSTNLDSAQMASLQITDMGTVPICGHYTLELTKDAADGLRKWKHIVSVTLNTPKKGQKDERLFPAQSNFKWNLDFYGPLRIPRQGMCVRLTKDTLPLYEKIIVEYEHNKLFVRNDSIFINGKYATRYIFQMNYYFMMGDNRHYSWDSRFWGFVPEDHIVGKAVVIITSIDKTKKKWRWNRILKKIE